MKKILLVSIILLGSTIGFGQNNKLIYTEVVHVDSTSKSELYKRARLWFNDTFRNSKNVIQINDKEAGEIVGKGTIKYISKIYLGSGGTKGYIIFTVKIYVKDNRYKYEITNFIHEGTPTHSVYGNFPPCNFNLITNDVYCPYDDIVGGKKWKDKVWNDIKTTIIETAIPLTESIKKSMQQPVDDEW